MTIVSSRLSVCATPSPEENPSLDVSAFPVFPMPPARLALPALPPANSAIDFRRVEPPAGTLEVIILKTTASLACICSKHTNVKVGLPRSSFRVIGVGDRIERPERPDGYSTSYQVAFIYIYARSLRESVAKQLAPRPSDYSVDVAF